MTWTKLDDAAPQHPKAKQAGNDAWCLWVAAIVYSNRYLTDGVVSVGVLATECLPQPISLAKAKKLAEQLCDVKQRPGGEGLFVRLEGGFYGIHDFAAYNPTKAEIEAKRQADRDRKKGGRGGGGSSAPPPGNPSGNPPGIPSGNPSGNDGGSERSPSGVPARVTPAGARPPVPPRPVPPAPAQPLAVSLEVRAKRWIEDPNRAQFEHPQPERWPEILSLQAKLAEVFGNPIEQPRNPKDPRCRLPLERYAEGYSEEQLLIAIEGAKQSKSIGETREYQVLTTILRDAQQVDKLAALARPSGALRKVPSVAERIAADEAAAAADRAARGLRVVGNAEPVVPTKEEFEAMLNGVGGSIG